MLSEEYSPEHLTGLLGIDTGDSLSPLIHNQVYRQRGISAVYKSFSLDPENFSRAFMGARALGLRGLNLTYPFKEEVLPFLDDITSRAESVGAVNTVHFGSEIRGYNTDILALNRLFTGWFDGAGEEIKVLLVGAGGAARAVAAALKELNFLDDIEIIITNRTAGRAEKLADELLAGEDGISVRTAAWQESSLSRVVGEVNLIADATPLGWKGELFPGAGSISAAQRVFDLSYPHPAPPLMELAEKRGARRENGLRMLLYQAEAAHEIWFEDTEFALELLPDSRLITMD